MQITFNKYHNDTIEEVAEMFGVDKEKLKDMYVEIMKFNFFDDLCDVVRENESELKGE